MHGSNNPPAQSPQGRALVPTQASLARIHRRQDRRAEVKRKRHERAQQVINKMRNGAVLCRHHQRNRIVWCLVWRGGSEWLTHEAAGDALASGQIVGVGDALPFAGTELSQTFRWCEP
jgi:hypothetical protein